MAFIPNENDANWTDQAEPDSVDFDVLLLGHQRTGVQSGCAVTGDGAQSDVDVASGVVVLDGKPITVSAQNNKSVTAADGSNPRFDLISINSSGTAVVTAGTAAAVPVAPEIPASSVPLAFLYVPANDNTHVTTQITDKRVFLSSTGVWYTFAASDSSAWEKANANEALDGTNDQVQIQAALDAGYSILFANGTYDIQEPIKVASGRTIMGSGWGTMLKANGLTSGERGVFVTKNNDTRGAMIRDLTINLDEWGGGGPCHGIYFYNNNMDGDPAIGPDTVNKFVNLYIYGNMTSGNTTYSGIYLRSTTYDMRGCIIDHCRIRRTGHSNYRLEGASDTLISNCVGNDSNGNGFHIGGGSTRLVACKQSFANGIGFYLGSSRALMSGCEAQDNGEEGVYVANVDCTIEVHVDSNGRLGTAAGVYLGSDRGKLTFNMMNRNNDQEYGIQWGSGINGWNVLGTINNDIATPVQGTPGSHNLIAIALEDAAPITQGY